MGYCCEPGLVQLLQVAKQLNEGFRRNFLNFIVHFLICAYLRSGIGAPNCIPRLDKNPKRERA